MYPVEENKKVQRHGSRNMSIIMFVLLVVVLIGVAVLVYLQSTGVDLKKISIRDLVAGWVSLPDKESRVSEKPLEINYDLKDHPAFIVYKNTIVKCTKEGITGMDGKGEELWNVPVIMVNPVMKLSNNDLLVADIGGRDICVINGKEKKWDVKLESAVLNADISESGYVTVVQEAKGYKARVSVYDPNGMEMFFRNIAENFILSAQVSPSGEKLLINGIDASGVSASTVIEFTDMLGNPVAAKIPMQNIIFPSVWFLKDNSVAAVSDGNIVFLDKEKNIGWNKEFGKVYSSCTVIGKYIAAAVRDKDGNTVDNTTKIKVINMKGQTVSEYSLDEQVVNMNAYSDIIGINSGREVYFITAKGRLQGKYTSKSDVLGVYFFNKTEAVIVTKAGVIVYKIG